MTNVLVTGAAGFIGSHVARHALELGHRVAALDDLSGGFADNVPSDAEFIHGSVTDEELLGELFERFEFDHVFHLAAYAAEGLSHYIRRFNYTNNVIGSVNLINESVKHDVKRFVFTSSIAVYGANQVPMTEDMTPQPEDPYGIAKYAVELDLMAAHNQFGLDYTIFRPHNVYGEHQNIGDKYRNVVGIFMNQIMRESPMTIFGDGSQTRAFSYIDDVAPAIAISPDLPHTAGETYNIGADQPRSVLSLAHIVAAVFGVEPTVEFLPERNEVIHAYATHEKAHAAFDLENPTPLEIGIGRMAEWARSVGPRSAVEFDQIEVWEDFPAGWESSVRKAE